MIKRGEEMQGEDKRTINVLANISNYLAEHEGKNTPWFMFLGVSAAPFLIYAFIFQGMIPLKFMLIFETLWAARWALYFLGNEPKLLKQYRAERKGIYKTADNLIHCDLMRDGLIEYNNGQVAYILSGYLLDYMNPDALTVDLQNFLKQLRGYQYDILGHLDIDEDRLQDNIEALSVYTDKEMTKERMLMYQDQDDYCSKHSEAYKISIVVKTSKYNWKVLFATLSKLVSSEFAYCWKELKICNKEEANDVMSRDLCLNIDITEMLVEKYKTDEFYGSKVLFYGDEIPEEFREEKESPNIQSRRVIMK